MPGGGNHYDRGHVLFLMQTYAWLEPLKLSEAGRRRLLLLAFIAKSSSVEPE
jgi:hypothetical protein